MWLGSFFRGDHSPTTTSAPSSEQLVPSGSLISYQQVRVITVVQILLLYYLTRHNHAKFSPFSPLSCSTQSSKYFFFLSLTHNSGGYNSWSGRCSHVSGSYSVHYYFLRFGGGRTIHALQILIYKNSLDILTTCFTKSSLMVLR
jgi:hypothetical protein